MLLTAVHDEFSFHCQCRNLSPRTIKNYLKQIDYLLRFLRQEHKVIHIEDVEPKQIRRKEKRASKKWPPFIGSFGFFILLEVGSAFCSRLKCLGRKMLINH